MRGSNSVAKIFCDGGSRGNPGPAAAAFVVEIEGKIISKNSKFLGKTTNNVAEYSAVVMALSWLNENLSQIPAAKLLMILDSELVAKQMSGDFKIKNENLRGYFLTAKNLERKTGISVEYHSVPRDKNKLADFLVNKELDQKR